MLLGFLKSLFGLFEKIGTYLTNRQLIEAGKAERTVEAVKEVEAHVAEAERASTVVDAPRTERLRNRFDRSRAGLE